MVSNETIGGFLWHQGRFILVGSRSSSNPARQGKGAGGEDPNLPFCVSVPCFPELSLGCCAREFGLIPFSAGSPEAI